MKETAPALRIAAVLFLVQGLGFTLWTIPVLRSLVERGEMPRVFGFEFEKDIQRRVERHEGWPPSFYGLGPDALVPLFVALTVLGLLEAAAGALLWAGDRRGAILGLALLPAGAIFWWGFGLPLPPLGALARTVLILANWGALRP